MHRSDSRVSILQWDGEWVVFHEASGDLHLLNDVAVAVLMKLQGWPMNLSSLAGEVAESLGYESDDQFEQRIADLLREFNRVGLATDIVE